MSKIKNKLFNQFKEILGSKGSSMPAKVVEWNVGMSSGPSLEHSAYEYLASTFILFDLHTEPTPEQVELFGLEEASWALLFVCQQELPLSLEDEVFYAMSTAASELESYGSETDPARDFEYSFAYRVTKPWMVCQLAYIASELESEPLSSQLVVRGRVVQPRLLVNPQLKVVGSIEVGVRSQSMLDVDGEVIATKLCS